MAADEVIIPFISNGADQLYVSQNLITPEMEQQLIEQLLKESWFSVGSGANSRRVIHFGRRYDYHARKDAGDTTLIPNYIQFIIDHLIAQGVMPRVEQVIVNEYLPGQSIAAHSDIQAYGDTIASIALGEDTNFIFRGANQVIKAYQPRRSILVMAGTYRNNYTHEIPARKTVDLPDGSRRSKTNARISLTLRYMK